MRRAIAVARYLSFVAVGNHGFVHSPIQNFLSNPFNSQTASRFLQNSIYQLGARTNTSWLEASRINGFKFVLVASQALVELHRLVCLLSASWP